MTTPFGVPRPLALLGWLFVVVDLIGAAVMTTSRGGDAATRRSCGG